MFQRVRGRRSSPASSAGAGVGVGVGVGAGAGATARAQVKHGVPDRLVQQRVIVVLHVVGSAPSQRSWGWQGGRGSGSGCGRGNADVPPLRLLAYTQQVADIHTLLRHKYAFVAGGALVERVKHVGFQNVLVLELREHAFLLVGRTVQRRGNLTGLCALCRLHGTPCFALFLARSLLVLFVDGHIPVVIGNQPYVVLPDKMRLSYTGGIVGKVGLAVRTVEADHVDGVRMRYEWRQRTWDSGRSFAPMGASTNLAFLHN